MTMRHKDVERSQQERSEKNAEVMTLEAGAVLAAYLPPPK
jgi:hypothetical protein